MLSQIDLALIKFRLDNIKKQVTKSISFTPSDTNFRYQDFYLSSTISCLEDPNESYPIKAGIDEKIRDWSVFAYDESSQNFRALEGELIFFSSSVIKIDKFYQYNLSVLPYFLTSIRKFKKQVSDEIQYTEEANEARNRIFIENKTQAIVRSVEPGSIIFIDGPLIGGNMSSYMVKMDSDLRAMGCIPVYFVKNSDSRLIVDTTTHLAEGYNSDFHWASLKLKPSERTAFFKYMDEHNKINNKVFTYIKPIQGFAERIEMHFETFHKYAEILPSILNLIEYYYIAQGDPANPQVRPITIAEKYAREGLRVINVPVLLGRLGFQPIVNQVRFG